MPLQTNVARCNIHCCWKLCLFRVVCAAKKKETDSSEHKKCISMATPLSVSEPFQTIRSSQVQFYTRTFAKMASLISTKPG